MFHPYCVQDVSGYIIISARMLWFVEKDLFMSSNRPSGTVTFLFTDIEDSTKLWEHFPEAMKAALATHDSIL